MRVWAIMLDEGMAGRTLISLWSSEELAETHKPTRDYIVEEWPVDEE